MVLYMYFECKLCAYKICISQIFCTRKSYGAISKINYSSNCEYVRAYAQDTHCFDSVSDIIHPFPHKRNHPISNLNLNVLYYILSSLSQYYINVCRPLVPQYHLGCNGNTAACRAVNSSNELNEEKVQQHQQNIIHPKKYYIPQIE